MYCLRRFSLLACAPLLAATAKGSPGLHGGLPTPAGLQQCPPDDPVGKLEASVAEKLGGAYLGCFQSARRAPLPGVATSGPVPIEYGFAIALRDSNYTSADLRDMLATVRTQWKGFDPLSTEFRDSYIARLNGMIGGNGELSNVRIAAIKPLLFAIEEGKDNYYTVTSIRTYSTEMNGQWATFTKVSADAVVLQGSRIIRLTIQRTLTDPADVTQTQGEIADWARATALGTPPSAH